MKDNKYTNAMSKLDISNTLKSKIIEEIKKEDIRKESFYMKIKNKIITLVSILGIITCGGVAYATIIPQEWKNNITNLINSYFGTEYKTSDYTGEVQEKTLEGILESDKQNIEKYSRLLDADTYGIGDTNSGTLIESNYDQYNWTQYDYDENGEPIKNGINLKKYSDVICIKMAMINYGCIEKFEIENTILDKNGKVIKRIEPTMDEILSYQYNEFSNNWDEYYYREEKLDEELYFKITGMTLMNGNNLTTDNYYNNARAKKIKVTINDKEEIINLLDTPKAQFVDLSYIQKDITKPIEINVEILEVYDGKISEDVYIADIQFGMTSNIPMGR